LETIHKRLHLTADAFSSRGCKCRIGIQIHTRSQQSGKQIELSIEELSRCRRIERKRLRTETLEASDTAVPRISCDPIPLRVAEIPPEVVVAEIVIRPEVDTVGKTGALNCLDHPWDPLRRQIRLTAREVDHGGWIFLIEVPSYQCFRLEPLPPRRISRQKP